MLILKATKLPTSHFTSTSFARPKTTGVLQRQCSILLSSTNYRRNHANAFRPVRASQSGGSSALESNRFDIIIAGAGIIGMTIARQFLLGSSLSVAVNPCFGATGAGQGYIWRVHKAPTNEKWELAIRSHQLWEAPAESIEGQGMDPALTIGWKKTGCNCQLVGFSTQIEESILHRIWERAGVFFLVMREVSLSDLIKAREVRVGLRPYLPAGKSVISPVPGLVLPKMFIAAGHEGEGLSMALVTAEIMFDMVLGNPHRVRFRSRFVF